MAITPVYTTGAANGTTGTASFTLTPPVSTAQAGDVAVVVAGIRNTADGISKVADTAAGTRTFTKLRYGGTSAQGTTSIWYRVLQAGDPGVGNTNTWTVTNNLICEAALLCYRGVDNTTPIDAQGTVFNVASGATVTFKSVTTVTPGAMFIGVGCASQTGANLTSQSSGTPTLTKRADAGNGGNVGAREMVCAVDGIITNAGATGDFVWTWVSSSSAGTADSFALRPFVAPGPKTETLVDAFATADSAKWNYAIAGADVSVSGGQVSIANGTELDAVGTFDLTASSMLVQVSTAGTLFQWGIQVSGKSLVFTCDGTTLAAEADGGSVATAAYSATNHRWMKISESSGTITWATSTSGSSWTTFTTASYSGVPTNGTLFLVGQGPSVFDNYNNPPAGTATATLTDDFTTLDTTTKWIVEGVGVTVASGQLSIVAGTGPTPKLYSKTTYDLRGSSLYCKAVQKGDATSWAFGVRRPGDNTWCEEIIIEASTALRFRESVANVTNETTVTYDAVAHLWWRVRESGGTIFWDTSPDGTSASWVNRRSQAAGMSVANVEIFFLAFKSPAGSVASLWDNCNIAGVAAPTAAGGRQINQAPLIRASTR